MRNLQVFLELRDCLIESPKNLLALRYRVERRTERRGDVGSCSGQLTQAPLELAFVSKLLVVLGLQVNEGVCLSYQISGNCCRLLPSPLHVNRRAKPRFLKRRGSGVDLPHNRLLRLKLSSCQFV